MSKLILIKTIVGILTFLLIFGLLCFMGLLFSKTKTGKTITFTEAGLNEPAGSTIQNFEYNNDLLYILVKDGRQSDRIIIFDPKSGQKVSKIKLN